MALSAPAALAAPPNDDLDEATEIFGLPFFDEVDTTDATTAEDDPDCVGQGPTVWYAFTPSEDTEIAADTFGSDYDTTLSVYTGTRGDLEQLACNDDAGGFQSRVRFQAIAGETYLFMVGAFASGSGGTLQFSVDVAPPAAGDRSEHRSDRSIRVRDRRGGDLRYPDLLRTGVCGAER